MRKTILAVVCLVFALQILFCKDNSEEIALGIYNEAKALEDKGDQIAALTKYDELIMYDKTQSYLKAKKELLKRGISIGASLSSFTIIRMMKIKGEILSYQKKTNQLPTLDIIGKHFDAWGKEMTIEIGNSTKCLFTIFSPGPDGIDSTKDDLVLAHSNKGKCKPEKNQVKQGGELTINLDELKKYNKDNNDASEISVALEALEKFKKDTTKTQEKTMDLSTLLEKNKQQNNNN